MPEWLQWILILAGLAATVFLAVFILRQSRVIKRGKARDQRNLEFRQKRREDMAESIRVLAMAVEEDQMEYSEACLRIKGLLDHLEPELMQHQPYRVFQEVHDQIAHMPTHEARQQTETRFVEKMDAERRAVEERHHDRIRRAATALRGHTF